MSDRPKDLGARLLLRPAGFTIIELLVVVAIVGILFAIVWPTYAAHRDRAQRSDARIWLMRLAADQQAFFIREGRYASTVAELGMTSIPAMTPRGHYRLQVASSSTNGFVVRAERVAADREAKRCRWFTLDQTQARGSGPRDAGECWLR